MAGYASYTMGKLTQILEMPEPEILVFIEAHHLIAEFNQALMAYTVTHQHLVDFMKARKMYTLLPKIIVSRVLLCDRDQKMVFLLRTELERGGKVQVKVATTGAELEMAARDFLPDVMAMPMATIQRAEDNLTGPLRKAREQRSVHLILYHPQPDALVAERDDTKRMMEYLKVDELISTAPGTRNLVASIEVALGLRAPSRRIGSGPLAAVPGAPPAPGPGGTPPLAAPPLFPPAPGLVGPPTRRLPPLAPLAPPSGSPAPTPLNPPMRRTVSPILPLAPPPEEKPKGPQGPPPAKPKINPILPP